MCWPQVQGSSTLWRFGALLFFVCRRFFSGWDCWSSRFFNFLCLWGCFFLFFFLFFNHFHVGFGFSLGFRFGWRSGCGSSWSLGERADSKETSDQCSKQFVHEKYSIYFSCQSNTVLNLHVQRGVSAA